MPEFRPALNPKVYLEPAGSLLKKVKRINPGDRNDETELNEKQDTCAYD